MLRRKIKHSTIIASAFISCLPGCATITNGSTQTMKILTRNQAELPTTCSAENEEGHWQNISPDTEFTIHRDGNPLVAQCDNPQQASTGSAEPTFQPNYLFMDFLLVDACIISCIIDGVNNAFYDYEGIVIVPMQDK